MRSHLLWALILSLSIVRAKVSDTFRLFEGMGQMVRGHKDSGTRKQTSGVDLKRGEDFIFLIKIRLAWKEHRVRFPSLQSHEIINKAEATVTLAHLHVIYM